MVQSKSGRVELAFKGRIVAGDAARGLNEASTLPLGDFQRGAVFLGWEPGDELGEERLEFGMIDEHEEARERGCRQECESGPG